MVLNETDLTGLIKTIEDLKDKSINEQNTRMILIEPLLSFLGWDTSNIGEIFREHPTSSKNPVDYKLQINDQILYIEAKKLSAKLSSEFQRQITTYAFHDNIPYCVLTNGKKYQIFETLKNAQNLSEKLILEIDLVDKEKDITSKVKALNFMSKESVSKGKLKEIDEYFTLRNKVEEAIQTIFLNPNAKFIDIISTEIRGNFEKKKIKNSIIEIGNEINFQESQRPTNATRIKINGVKTSRDIENDIKNLTDKLPDFRDIFLSLRNKIIKLGNDIREVYMPQYNAIGFRRDTEFTSMKIKPKNREIEFLLKFGEFEPNMNKISEIEIEPIPKTYRYGKMNSKMSINQEEQVDDAIKIIKQCYDLQLKWRK